MENRLYLKNRGDTAVLGENVLVVPSPISPEHTSLFKILKFEDLK